MGRVSTRSNPTNLKEIDKKRVSIQVSDVAGRRFFNITKLDLSGIEIAAKSLVVCVARAGKTSQRFTVGTPDHWKKEAMSLDGLDPSESLRFRILVHPDDNPKLVASAENLRPLDESLSESLLPMEPAELDQLLWRLDINDDGPVLKFNVSVFPSALGIENYTAFGALVLPEALRRVMETIAEEPAKLSDENDPFSGWLPWLEGLGVGRPPADAEPDEKRDWCNEVIDVFCKRHLFATRLGRELSIGGSASD